jgi:phenylpropionate dioxygenase-like ring-hydroxylating dioxygenase large terminal subunit
MTNHAEIIATEKQDAKGANPPIIWPQKANLLPKEIFVRPDVFEEELARIFYGKEWLMIAHEAEIPNIGDFKTAQLGRVPLLITRDNDGEINVCYNACSHRGVQLETATSGNKLRFRCPYHSWLFNAKGDLIGCPNKPGDFPSDFDKSNYPLDRPRMAIVHGLILVTFNPETPPIEEYLEGYIDKIAQVFGGDGNLRLLGAQKVVFHANWKTFHDNDTYHAGLLHTAFQMLNWSGGSGHQTANARGHRSYVGEVTLPEEVNRLKDPSLIEFKGEASECSSASVRLFPISGMTRHLNTIGIRFANPISVDETEVHYTYFGRAEDDEEMIRHRVRQASNLLGPCGMVSMEDAAVFHRLHTAGTTPGNAVFLKGVTDDHGIPEEFQQSDEAANLPGWEHYRQTMGYPKEQS